MQLIYSMWRAGDRVGLAFFDTEVREQIRAANLRSQLQQTVQALRMQHPRATTDVSSALNAFVRQDRRRHSNLLFVVSDFVTTNGNDIRPEVEWRDAINEIQQNIVPVIVSFELAPQTEGLVKLRDAERPARRLAWFTRDRVRRINDEERSRVAALVRHCRSATPSALPGASRGLRVTEFGALITKNAHASLHSFGIAAPLVSIA